MDEMHPNFGQKYTSVETVEKKTLILKLSERIS